MTNSLKTSFFTEEQLEIIKNSRIPNHIAIIPDGNRRWAKQQQLNVNTGYNAGADNIMDIVLAAKEIGVKVLTLYVFSTENWARDPDEVQALLWLLDSYLKEQTQTMLDNGIRFQTIGDSSRMPANVVETVNNTKYLTRDCKDIEIVFALNYGGRNEITRAFHKIMEKIEKGDVKQKHVDEQLISQFLDSAKWGDPDLLIRTSGISRFSNFLLWQISYAEFYLSPVFWPDFRPMHLLEAICEFQKRERRWGA